MPKVEFTFSFNGDSLNIYKVLASGLGKCYSNLKADFFFSGVSRVYFRSYFRKSMLSTNYTTEGLSGRVNELGDSLVLFEVDTTFCCILQREREKTGFFNHNEELLGRSMVLQGYAYFVESVRELAKTEDLRRKG